MRSAGTGSADIAARRPSKVSFEMGSKAYRDLTDSLRTLWILVLRMSSTRNRRPLSGDMRYGSISIVSPLPGPSAQRTQQSLHSRSRSGPTPQTVRSSPLRQAP